jgi:hypothetical protein
MYLSQPFVWCFQKRFVRLVNSESSIADFPFTGWEQQRERASSSDKTRLFINSIIQT